MPPLTTPIANPDTSGLISYAGDFKLPLLRKLYHSMNAQEQGIFVQGKVKSKINMHKMLVRKGLKPFTGTFAAKPDISFEPRVLEVEKAQRDLQIFPDKYRRTFAEKMRGDGENANNMTIPFAQFMWETVMQEQANEVVTESVYHGVGAAAFAAHNPASTYAVGALIKYVQDGELRYFRCITAAAAGENPDTNPEKWDWAGARAICKGFKAIFDAEVSAGKLAPVSIGAPDNVNAYDQFTTMYRSQLEVVRTQASKVLLLCSQDSSEALDDSVEKKFVNFKPGETVRVLPKTGGKGIIMPVPWLTGSKRIISTVVDNLVMGTDATSDQNIVKPIEQMYHIDFGLSFMMGFQVQDLDVLKISDQA